MRQKGPKMEIASATIIPHGIFKTAYQRQRVLPTEPYRFKAVN